MISLLQVADTLATTDVVEEVGFFRLIGNLFIQGGCGGMLVITALLVLLLVAAWKFPKIVKEIGLFTLFFGVFMLMIGLMQAFDTCQIVGSFPQNVWAGGFKVALLQPVYATSVYLLSLVIRIVHKLLKK